MSESSPPKRTHTLVLGAGSAGCIVAARLSARGDRDVVLVDAGPDYTPASLPADLANGHRNALNSHGWGLTHRPSTTPVRLPLPRGRVVGGSSAVNTCIAIRPLPRDLDEWVQRGLGEWDYDTCLPAMRDIETDLDFGDQRPDLHGSRGPLPLRRHPPSAWTPWQAAFVEAARTLGFDDCADTNDPTTPEGVGAHAMNQIDGRRVSVAEAWLTPEVRSRDTLRILHDTTAHRVLFDGRRAVGALLVQDGVEHVVYADEVVVTAGAIHTPELLLRSGVGPPAELTRLGVPVVVPSPGVGHQLLDHPGFAMFFRARYRGVRVPDGPLIQTVLRCSSHDGPWAHDLQLQAGTHVPLGDRNLPAVSLMAMLGKTRGHGRIRWPSLKPGTRPIIESRFHHDPEDRRRAVTAMALARELAAQPVMRDLAVHLWPTERQVATRAGLSRWVPWATDSGYHPSGTCPMGLDTDPTAVTDSRGRVHGTDRLTIADASLFPTIPTGNIHLTVLMVAHRIAGWLGGV